MLRRSTFFMSFCLLGTSSLFAAWHPQQLVLPAGYVYQYEEEQSLPGYYYNDIHQGPQQSYITMQMPNGYMPCFMPQDQGQVMVFPKATQTHYFPGSCLLSLQEKFAGWLVKQPYLFNDCLNFDFFNDSTGEKDCVVYSRGFFVNQNVTFSSGHEHRILLASFDYLSKCVVTEEGLLFEKIPVSVLNGEPFYIVCVEGVFHYIPYTQAKYVSVFPEYAGPFVVENNHTLVSVQQQNASTPTVASSVASTQPATVLPVTTLLPTQSGEATSEERAHLADLVMNMAGVRVDENNRVTSVVETLHTTEPMTRASGVLTNTNNQVTGVVKSLHVVKPAAQEQEPTPSEVPPAEVVQQQEPITVAPKALPPVAKLPVTTVCDTKMFPTPQEALGKQSAAPSVPKGAWGKPVIQTTAAQKGTPTQVAPQAAQTKEKVIQSVPEKHEEVTEAATVEALPAQPRTLVTSKDQTGPRKLTAKERRDLKKKVPTAEGSPSSVAAASIQEFPALTSPVVQAPPLSASAKKRLARLQAEEKREKQVAVALAAQTAQAAVAASELATKKTVESKGKNTASTIKTKKEVGNQAVFAKWDEWFASYAYDKIYDEYRAAGKTYAYPNAPRAFLMHACLSNVAQQEKLFADAIRYTENILKLDAPEVDQHRKVMEATLRAAQIIKSVMECSSIPCKCAIDGIAGDDFAPIQQIVIKMCAAYWLLRKHPNKMIHSVEGIYKDVQSYAFLPEGYKRNLLLELAAVQNMVEARKQKTECVSSVSYTVNTSNQYFACNLGARGGLVGEYVGLIKYAVYTECTYEKLKEAVYRALQTATRCKVNPLITIAILKESIAKAVEEESFNEAQKQLLFTFNEDLNVQLAVLSAKDTHELQGVVTAELAVQVAAKMPLRRSTQRIDHIIKAGIVMGNKGFDMVTLVKGAITQYVTKTQLTKEQIDILKNLKDFLESQTEYLGMDVDQVLPQNQPQTIHSISNLCVDTLRRDMFDLIDTHIGDYHKNPDALQESVHNYLKGLVNLKDDSKRICKELNDFSTYFLTSMSETDHKHALICVLSKIKEKTQDPFIKLLAITLWIRLSALDVYQDFRDGKEPRTLELLVQLRSQGPLQDIVDDIVNPALTLCSTSDHYQQMLALLRTVLLKYCRETEHQSIVGLLDKRIQDEPTRRLIFDALQEVLQEQKLPSDSQDCKSLGNDVFLTNLCKRLGLPVPGNPPSPEKDQPKGHISLDADTERLIEACTVFQLDRMAAGLDAIMDKAPTNLKERRKFVAATVAGITKKMDTKQDKQVRKDTKKIINAFKEEQEKILAVMEALEQALTMPVSIEEKINLIKNYKCTIAQSLNRSSPNIPYCLGLINTWESQLQNNQASAKAVQHTVASIEQETELKVTKLLGLKLLPEALGKQFAVLLTNQVARCNNQDELVKAVIGKAMQLVYQLNDGLEKRKLIELIETGTVTRISGGRFPCVISEV